MFNSFYLSISSIKFYYSFNHYAARDKTINKMSNDKYLRYSNRET